MTTTNRVVWWRREMYVRAVKSRGRVFHYWARKERDAVTGRWVERKIRRLTEDEVKQLAAKATCMATTHPLNSPEKTAPVATAPLPEATRVAAAPTIPPPSLQSDEPLRIDAAAEKMQLPKVFGYRVEYHGEVSVGRFYKLIPTVVGMRVGNVLIANDGEITCACSHGECEHAQAIRRALRVKELMRSD